MNSTTDAIVIGGGLAGLSCTRRLVSRGLRCRLLEADNRIGGRVQTDRVDGFLLDRGFQVFLTAYPEARALLDYDRLGLGRFDPGALVRFGGRFHRLADPWRQPSRAAATVVSRAATLGDKLRIARMRSDVRRGELGALYERPSESTLQMLRGRGFSEKALERFFRPFFGGIFLDPTLQTTSRMAEFVFRMFAEGHATLPARGMGEIPNQLARGLPEGVLRTGCKVGGIAGGPEGSSVRLESGETLDARAVVIATEAPVASGLLGDSVDPLPPRGIRRVENLYFAADRPPIGEPALVLNGEGPAAGPINNLAVPSLVSPGYAPAGQSLVSVSVLESGADKPSLLEGVRGQLEAWFGPAVRSWRHLKTYSLSYALPSQLPEEMDPVVKPARIGRGVYVAGDHRDTASINGAFASGRRAADAVAADLA